MFAGNVDLIRRRPGPLHQFPVPDEVLRPHTHPQERHRGCHADLRVGEVSRIQRVDPRRFQRDLHRQIALRPHVGVARAQHQLLAGKGASELAFQERHPVRFTRRIEVMRPRLQARFDHGAPQLHERPDDVDHGFLAAEQLDQRPFLVRDADAPIIVALQLGHFGHFLFQARLVPPGRDKGNAALGELPGRQLAGVSARAVKHHFISRCHSGIPLEF